MEDDQAPSFTFASVRAILARMQKIDDTKLKRFEARLQQLQKLGLPPGTNIGRAGRVNYPYWMLAELDAYLGFLDAGATPALLRSHFEQRPLYSMIYGQYVEDAPADREHHVGMRFNALHHLRTRDTNQSGALVFDQEIFSGYGPKFFAGLSEAPSIVINLTQRVALLKGIVSEWFQDYAGLPVFPGPPGALT